MANVPYSKALRKGFLKHGEEGLPSVEDLKKEMIAAREPVKTTKRGVIEPSFRGIGGAPKNAVQPTPQQTPERIPAQPAEEVEEIPVVESPIEDQIAPPAQPMKEEKIETEKFVAQIYRDGNEWIGEITYKPEAFGGRAPGTEKFKAGSKDGLILSLLKGKGSATLNVREANQKLKEGFTPDTWEKFFYGKVQTAHGMSKTQYDALPKESRAQIQDTIQGNEIMEWQKICPEYYTAPENFKLIADYLNKNGWPISVRNLTKAYSDLKGQLTPHPDFIPFTVPVVAPVVAPVVTAAPASIPAQVHGQAPVGMPPGLRKRGSTGLIPGRSSASPVSSPVPLRQETNGEPTIAELRAMSDADLKKLATKDRKYGRY